MNRWYYNAKLNLIGQETYQHAILVLQPIGEYWKARIYSMNSNWEILK